MEICRKKDALSFQDEVFNELYCANTLVNVTRSTCLEREFRGEYYGVPSDFVPMISNERNEYISLLTLIADKLKQASSLNLMLEKELSLHEYSDNRS